MTGTLAEPPHESIDMTIVGGYFSLLSGDFSKREFEWFFRPSWDATEEAGAPDGRIDFPYLLRRSAVRFEVWWARSEAEVPELFSGSHRFVLSPDGDDYALTSTDSSERLTPTWSSRSGSRVVLWSRAPVDPVTMIRGRRIVSRSRCACSSCPRRPTGHRGGVTSRDEPMRHPRFATCRTRLGRAVSACVRSTRGGRMGTCGR